ncbi:MAG: bifunctional aldolase/short-chain dehydrogenase [Actinobacteria bacterium]|nr:bifunctional aldolase/short-chain dehydrogenase [Actinomycetota bacterium]
MRSFWDDEEAARHHGGLAERVYSSRLLGLEPSLVLHGGGNTSVKVRERNILGEEEEILYVKGSGQDLATIEADGFAPVRIERLLALARLDSLSDTQMGIELDAAKTDPSAPAPSVEAILHAILPARFVDHTHADAVLSVTNTPSGEERVRELYGDAAVVVPYVMPGFELARLVAELFPAEATERTIGMVLLHHGVFSLGATAREAYERMIELVTRAEEYLAERGAWRIAFSGPAPPDRVLRGDLAALRAAVSAAAGVPLVLSLHADAATLGFARREDVGSISQRGPATPDHAIRTKRVPLVGRDVGAFAEAYARYFAEHAPAAGRPLTMLDPAPRVILDPELGMCAAGRSAREAEAVADIYRHTIEIVLRATALEAYEALPPERIFEVEYWELEQAKLHRPGEPPPLAGEVALVTGAASGIGAACASALLARGGAVAALDLDGAVAGLAGGPAFLGLRCDVTSEEEVTAALEATARRFGGLDVLVLNAGVFPPSRRIEALELEEWRRVMRVNVEANVVLLREAYPLLRAAPRGGRVVVVGSRNVAAPGPGAAVYSASKAALTQLARVAALEWGAEGIRVNVVHPDAVFDTALWTEEVLQARAEQYGLTVEAYRRRNVLGVEVASRDVGELVAELAGPLFAKTTGAQLPLDGGNERVI